MKRWSDVHDELAALPHGRVLSFAFREIADPRTEGAVESVGMLHSQRIDLRFPPDEQCRGLHVRGYADHWEAHLDRVHPSCDLLEHLRRDAPAALYVLGAGAGALIGRGIGNRAIVGSCIGLLIAAALDRS